LKPTAISSPPCFNLLKTLSGIETVYLRGDGARVDRFNLLKTLSGIETTVVAATVFGVIASTYSKPFQGLKQWQRVLGRHWRHHEQRFNLLKTLSGIETWQNASGCTAGNLLQPTQNPFRD